VVVPGWITGEEWEKEKKEEYECFLLLVLIKNLPLLI
jgi:hypothetical protein